MQVLLDTRLEATQEANVPTSSKNAKEELLSATVVVEDFLESPVQTIFSSMLGGYLVSIEDVSESNDFGIDLQFSSSIISDPNKPQILSPTPLIVSPVTG